MKRIVYLAHQFPVVTETFTAKEVRALREHGFDVAVRTMRAAPSGPPELDDLRPLAEVVEVRRASPRRLLYRPGLLTTRRRILAAARGAALGVDPERDHLHAQFPLEAASAGLFAAASGASFSFSIHTLHQPDLIEEKLRAAAFVVAGSEYERETVRRRYGETARAKVEVRRLGVPPRAARAGFEEGLIASVGTLTGKKGHDVLIRAVARLERPFRLVIVGEGPERSALESLVRELGLAGRVELPGVLSHDASLELVARAQVFALCCRETADGDHDFLPVALMDAMSLGVPSVSSYFVGIPELIEDGVSGLLAPPGDPAAARERLDAVLADRALAERLGAAGRERVRADYDLETNTARLAELFRGRLD